MFCKANFEEDGNTTECNVDFTFLKRSFIMHATIKENIHSRKGNLHNY